MTLRTNPLKPRKCKQCGEIFQRRTTTQTVCGPKCAEANAAKVRAQKAAKADKENRKSFRVAIEKAKRRADHLKELQDAVNAYVRLRDARDPCISCDKPSTWQGQWHASHFKSVGHAPALRFNLLNIHKACSVCNRYLGGNYAGYLPRLIEKIGAEQVAWLEGPHEPLKITVEEIQDLKAFYRAEVRKLKKEAA